MRIHFYGKMSTFGGPHDHGVRASEGLALVNDYTLPHYSQYFLPHQPPGTTGLARRLNPNTFYVACRWDHHATPYHSLACVLVKVTNPANGRSAYAKPIDWGPHERTGRVADLSPGLASFLGLRTDDIVEVKYN